MLNIKSFLSTLTQQPGVYQMLGSAGEVLYVGKARNLKKRVSSYFLSTTKDRKTEALISRIHDINITVTRSENEALILECNLIKKYKPYYNILFRDDKSYPYILIKNEEPYPCISFYRGNKKNDGLYLGPYPNSYAVRQAIHLTQKIFGIRACNDKYNPKRDRPCLKYQIGLCSGSCAGIISYEDYKKDIDNAILFLQGNNTEVIQNLTKKMQEYSANLEFEKAANTRDQVAKLRELHAKQYVSNDKGDVDVLGVIVSGSSCCIQLIMIRTGQMLGSRAYFTTVPIGTESCEAISSFITQHYIANNKTLENIPKEIIIDLDLQDKPLLESTLSQLANKKVVISNNVRGERKQWLATANASAGESISRFLNNKANINQRFTALEKTLDLSLIRIECFDISHTFGDSTVASCVVFDKNGAVKSSYRKFNITNITPGDDVAAMHQALLRRFNQSSSDAKHPSVILIDGGKTQLNSAKKSLNELGIDNIHLIGVAKGKSRKPGLETLHFLEKLPLSLPSDSMALHLIQQIRDEAHRFAITTHRSKRDKKSQKSILESIPGIGAKRRRDLLAYFGGIQALNRASLEEIRKVPGVSKPLAERVYAVLHDL